MNEPQQKPTPRPAPEMTSSALDSPFLEQERELLTSEASYARWYE